MARRRAKRFVPFVEHELGVTLEPGQRVLCRVAFDGEEPRDLEGADRVLARQLFGDVDVIPAAARHVIAVVCGARSGKTHILIALRALHLALTCDLRRLAPGQLAAALIVAERMTLAREALRFAVGAARSVPAIAKLIQAESNDAFTLARLDRARVEITVAPAARGGAAGRGRSLVFGGMDEACFFRDSDFIVNDEAVYEALAPRVLPDGQLAIVSTPWTETGLVWKFWRDQFGSPRTVLVAHAPTEAMRIDAHTLAQVERERERNPDNARREFDAEFVSGSASEFFDGPSLAHATRLEPLPRLPAMEIFAGADFGFLRDHSALVIVGRLAGRYEVLHVEELKPRPAAPLVPSRVCARFTQTMRRYEVSQLWADMHYSEAIREHLMDAGVTLRTPPGGHEGKEEVHTMARDMLRSGLIRIPPTSTELVQQLRAVVAKPTSGGRLAISAPRSPRGGHGDAASAAVLALWAANPRKVGGVGPLSAYGPSDDNWNPSRHRRPWQ